MAQRVVHLLEAIEIEEEQADALVPALRPLQRAAQPILEQLSIGQARQAIVVGEIADALLGLLALRNLADQSPVDRSELAGAPLDLLLQIQAVPRERLVAILDLLQHLVERLDQHADLVSPVAHRAHREVVVGRDTPRRLDEVLDRIGDEALQLGGQRQAGQAGDEHHQPEDPTVPRQPLVQVDRPGTDHDRAERVPFGEDRQRYVEPVARALRPRAVVVRRTAAAAPSL